MNTPAPDARPSLAVSHIDELSKQPAQASWLIEGLWAEQAVGVIGGEPKSCKTFLALDMALAVASGRPCLRQHAVPTPGPVLLFIAEDPPAQVAARLRGIAAASDVALTGLPLYVVTEAQLHLDLPSDRDRLEARVAELRLRLLILDPFVRLHSGINESSAGAVTPILGFLRALQRRYAVAIALVHHAKKGAGRMRAGQALRGSSDFHAWGDSNLYLRNEGKLLRLTLEHRAAPSTGDIPLQLSGEPEALALRHVAEPSEPAVAPPGPMRLTLRILGQLAGGPHSLRELRRSCGMRHEVVQKTLRELEERGAITRERGAGGAHIYRVRDSGLARDSVSST